MLPKQLDTEYSYINLEIAFLLDVIIALLVCRIFLCRFLDYFI